MKATEATRKADKFIADWTDETGKIQEREFRTASAAKSFARRKTTSDPLICNPFTVYVMPVVNNVKVGQWVFSYGMSQWES